MIIDLTTADMEHGCFIAAQQMVNAMRLHDEGKLDGRYGADVLDIWIEVRGCMGELAVAKAFNLGWFDHTRLGRIDVGDLIEVRAVDRSHFKLILHDPKKDPDDMPFVLADVTALPRVHLVGWVCGSVGRAAAGEMTDPTARGRWAYFVERGVLDECAALRRFAHEEVIARLLQREAA